MSEQEIWTKVCEYCVNDVLIAEAVFEALKAAHPLKVGTRLKCDEYGMGVIKKIDPKSKDFRFFVRFIGDKKNKGKPDETLIWLNEKDLAKLNATVVY